MIRKVTDIWVRTSSTNPEVVVVNVAYDDKVLWGVVETQCGVEFPDDDEPRPQPGLGPDWVEVMQWLPVWPDGATIPSVHIWGSEEDVLVEWGERLFRLTDCPVSLERMAAEFINNGSHFEVSKGSGPVDGESDKSGEDDEDYGPDWE